MKKEILERAKELEDQIGDYQLISYIMSYPYQRYKLFRKKPCIQHEGGTSTGIVITDRELAKLIEGRNANAAAKKERRVSAF